MVADKLNKLLIKWGPTAGFLMLFETVGRGVCVCVCTLSWDPKLQTNTMSVFIAPRWMTTLQGSKMSRGEHVSLAMGKEAPSSTHLSN